MTKNHSVNGMPVAVVAVWRAAINANPKNMRKAWSMLPDPKPAYSTFTNQAAALGLRQKAASRGRHVAASKVHVAPQESVPVARATRQEKRNGGKRGRNHGGECPNCGAHLLLRSVVTVVKATGGSKSRKYNARKVAAIVREIMR